MSDLTFDELRQANAERCPMLTDGWGVEHWNPAEWTNAMAGETGEACNLTKKMLRGDDIDVLDVGAELADVVIYADLVAQRLGIDLGRMVSRTFNKKSEKCGVDCFLPEAVSDRLPAHDGTDEETE